MFFSSYVCSGLNEQTVCDELKLLLWRDDGLKENICVSLCRIDFFLILIHLIISLILNSSSVDLHMDKIIRTLHAALTLKGSLFMALPVFILMSFLCLFCLSLNLCVLLHLFLYFVLFNLISTAHVHGVVV